MPISTNYNICLFPVSSWNRAVFNRWAAPKVNSFQSSGTPALMETICVPHPLPRNGWKVFLFCPILFRAAPPARLG